ncbi:hypothetical protein J1614_004731 [Plenodomus biglobosus]|nr:hypothetical protein J1614_004731 [Plenodomus biglobosus]
MTRGSDNSQRPGKPSLISKVERRQVTCENDMAKTQAIANRWSRVHIKSFEGLTFSHRTARLTFRDIPKTQSQRWTMNATYLRPTTDRDTLDGTNCSADADGVSWH